MAVTLEKLGKMNQENEERKLAYQKALAKAQAKLHASLKVLGVDETPEAAMTSPRPGEESAVQQSGVSDFGPNAQAHQEKSAVDFNLTRSRLSDIEESQAESLDNEAKLEMLKKIIGRATVDGQSRVVRDSGFS